MVASQPPTAATMSVHPFRDGNGRISRIIQSLVLARGGALAPEFVSIEEYLGRNTDAYFTTLQRVQGAATNPSATPPHGSNSASKRTSTKPRAGSVKFIRPPRLRS
jgi:fido (protein-threonine AMPylation protein)